MKAATIHALVEWLAVLPVRNFTEATQRQILMRLLEEEVEEQIRAEIKKGPSPPP